MQANAQRAEDGEVRSLAGRMCPIAGDHDDDDGPE